MKVKTDQNLPKVSYGKSQNFKHYNHLRYYYQDQEHK